MHQLKVEKTIARPAGEVFSALQQGRLFMNCSCDSSSMQIDFRVGGKYLIEFKAMEKTNFGEFLEIVPNKKIVFTWCQDFSENRKPDTRVSIELFADGSKTRLVLEHTGFKDKQVCDAHIQGWTSGLGDFSSEVENGRLRICRPFPVDVEQLYNTCKSPESFFAYMGDITRGSVDFKVHGKYQVPTKNGEVKGEFLEIEPNKKIVFSWLAGCGKPLVGSSVTMNFTKREKGGTLLELIHEGLKDPDDQMKHRAGWESITQSIAQKLAASAQH